MNIASKRNNKYLVISQGHARRIKNSDNILSGERRSMGVKIHENNYSSFTW